MKRILILCGLISMYLLPPTLTYAQQQDDPLWVKRLADAKALAKREGFPLSLAELPKRNVPNADNAATYASQLHDLKRKKPLSKIEEGYLNTLGPDIRSATPQQLEQAKQAFANRTDIAQLVEKAVACKNYYVPVKMMTSSTLLFPEFPITIMAEMRFVARYLAQKTSLLLREERYQEAIENQKKGFQLAHIVAQGYQLEEMLCANSIEAIALRGMETVLQFSGQKRGIASTVRKVIERESGASSFERALGVQLATKMDELERCRGSAETLKSLKSLVMSGDGGQGIFGFPTDSAQNVTRFINANETNFIKKTNVVMHTLPALYYKALPPDFPPNLNTNDGERSKNVDSCVADAFLSEWHTVRIYIAKHTARNAVLLTGAQVLAWKVKRDVFPNSLKEVISSVPLDPFDGKPLRYRKEGAGFVIYSVGDTGKYDGRVFEKGRWRESVFRYPAPPQKP
ncbi:MAG: hypothetical protein NT023_11655 [Armatimonadetes bacterium]|nr:hypothetical protein [Armatimonadota bacterium]